MVLHHELDLFYDTPIVCGYSNSKGLKPNPRHITLFQYINDRLPKVVNIIPHNVVVTHPNQQPPQKGFGLCLDLSSTHFSGTS
jgi:hypothetical protein